MRLRTVILSVLCLILTGCFSPSAKSSWKNATGAEQHERLLWQSIHDRQWNEVENHVSATFVGVSANGQKFDRAGWVEYWKSHPPGEFTLGEFSVQPAGADMVVNYQMQFNGAGAQVLSVWQQLKHGWVLISQSMTPITSN